ncbi:MAG: hypothetical protein Q7O12_14940 [Deltaproteobacteria bacterium]|nr:hypothetical protein [Deltaproteobacteria bacterium]
MQDDKPHRTMGEIINKIFRGASKEKNSIKGLKVRIAGPEDLSPEQLNFINDELKKGVLHHFLVYGDSDPPKVSAKLSSKQQDIISLLGRYVEPMNAIKEQKLRNDINEQSNDILEAVRAKLIWHPLVSDFIYTHKALGSKEILRKIKRGWETGVKRPLTINDLKFRNRLEEIFKYRKEGKTWLQIRRILMKGKIIKKMSWQALQKRFEKAWEEEWKKVNKKAPIIP